MERGNWQATDWPINEMVTTVRVPSKASYSSVYFSNTFNSLYSQLWVYTHVHTVTTYCLARVFYYCVHVCQDRGTLQGVLEHVCLAVYRHAARGKVGRAIG